MFNSEAITENVIMQVMQHMQWKFHHQLFFAPPDLPQLLRNNPHPLQQSPLKEQIHTLCRVANGEVDRTVASEEFVGEVMEMTQSLVETLYSVPMDGTYAIPDHFWQTEVGQVVAQAQLWANNDELITLSEAAQILRGASEDRDLVYVNSLIKKGNLRRYVDPEEPNSQRAGRVSKKAVEELRA